MNDKNAPEIVKVGDQPSSQTIEPCSSEASQDGRDDQAHLSDPVGCAILRSSEPEHLTVAQPLSCGIKEWQRADQDRLANLAARQSAQPMTRL